MVNTHQILAAEQFKKNPDPRAKDGLNQPFKTVQAFIQQSHFAGGLKWADVGEVALILLFFKLLEYLQLRIFQQGWLCTKREHRGNTTRRPGNGNE